MKPPEYWSIFVYWFTNFENVGILLKSNHKITRIEIKLLKPHVDHGFVQTTQTKFWAKRHPSQNYKSYTPL